MCLIGFKVIFTAARAHLWCHRMYCEWSKYVFIRSFHTAFKWWDIVWLCRALNSTKQDNWFTWICSQGGLIVGHKPTLFRHYWLFKLVLQWSYCIWLCKSVFLNISEAQSTVHSCPIPDARSMITFMYYISIPYVFSDALVMTRQSCLTGMERST